ncbi:helix-turn-helix domain-containing protein [Mycolicibacterium goodii]|uniref:IclR family transcriptional regulator n=1 Tax=Mycolicibacterium goodii TaxID=134601 RepID=UPI001F042901|nr:IclR family transcriptional regulator C-terminal domain-containing protein [Mycolicibacterium goodii]ULN49593.1 helix-turn-helix domain-containing protein [Mycolicibacterium goodii]
MLNTIERAGMVLNLFTVDRPEWGVTEMAVMLGLAKSTTFDIVASLAEIGLLQQTSDDRYRLGWRLLLISRRLMNSSCFGLHTHRAVAELSKRLKAAVNVGVWDGQGVISIVSAAAGRVGHDLPNDVYLPGYTSALGRLLIAQLPWTKVKERMPQNGAPLLAYGPVTDATILREELLSVRDQDLAIEHGRTITGHSCIAVGIHRRERRAVAALSICMPSERLQRNCDEYIGIARRAARALMQQAN